MQGFLRRRCLDPSAQASARFDLRQDGAHELVSRALLLDETQMAFGLVVVTAVEESQPEVDARIDERGIDAQRGLELLYGVVAHLLVARLVLDGVDPENPDLRRQAFRGELPLDVVEVAELATTDASRRDPEVPSGHATDVVPG